ncbi:MAG: diguanylate cyclase [Deltaproteobacteria bacterium]|nr:diguanylate cyclase [Deltaproteobacteria bacterium]MBW2218935.1 diguanylate cyclase [Deltaproteobacteria bacterium]
MKTNILIVDDDAAIRESMQEFLELEEFKVLSVSNAEEAIDFLKKNQVDIVLTDIIMFEMDGLELTNLIKKEYDTDVVVMTGYTSEHSYEQAISKGASDFLFKPVRFEELSLRLKRVLKERQLSSERSEMLRELKKLAITDGLTGLFNSRHFYKQLDIEVDRIKRYKHSISVLIIDIDHFKDFNDSFGHMEGDKLLVRLGALIKSCLRRMDTAYRYGGEEFTVILPETNNADAIIVAERIRKIIAEETFIPSSGEKIAITVSIGSTEYQAEERISTFVQRADKALYVSKDLGRNRISSLPD